MRPLFSNLIDTYRNEIKAAKNDLNAFQDELDVLEQNERTAKI